MVQPYSTPWEQSKVDMWRGHTDLGAFRWCVQHCQESRVLPLLVHAFGGSLAILCGVLHGAPLNPPLLGLCVDSGEGVDAKSEVVAVALFHQLLHLLGGSWAQD